MESAEYGNAVSTPGGATYSPGGYGEVAAEFCNAARACTSLNQASTVSEDEPGGGQKRASAASRAEVDAFAPVTLKTDANSRPGMIGAAAEARLSLESGAGIRSWIRGTNLACGFADVMVPGAVARLRDGNIFHMRMRLLEASMQVPVVNGPVRSPARSRKRKPTGSAPLLAVGHSLEISDSLSEHASTATCKRRGSRPVFNALPCRFQDGQLHLTGTVSCLT